MKQVNWASAGKYCADRNAQLVAIANEEEQKALTLYLKKQAKGTHITRRIVTVALFICLFHNIAVFSIETA